MLQSKVVFHHLSHLPSLGSHDPFMAWQNPCWQLVMNRQNRFIKFAGIVEKNAECINVILMQVCFDSLAWILLFFSL